MNRHNKKYTKIVTLGWWLSLAFFTIQSLLINVLALNATPIIGFIVFASFVILSINDQYDKGYRFSPYRAIKKINQK